VVGWSGRPALDGSSVLVSACTGWAWLDWSHDVAAQRKWGAEFVVTIWTDVQSAQAITSITFCEAVCVRVPG
jgi:hypothetical protein